MELKTAPTRDANSRKVIIPKNEIATWKLRVPKDVSSIIIADETFAQATIVPDEPKGWKLFVLSGASLVDIKDALLAYRPPSNTLLKRIAIHDTRIFPNDKEGHYTVFTDIQKVATKNRWEVAYLLIPISDKYRPSLRDRFSPARS